MKPSGRSCILCAAPSEPVPFLPGERPVSPLVREWGVWWPLCDYCRGQLAKDNYWRWNAFRRWITAEGSPLDEHELAAIRALVQRCGVRT